MQSARCVPVPLPSRQSHFRYVRASCSVDVLMQSAESARQSVSLGRVQRWNVLVGALSVFAPTRESSRTGQKSFPREQNSYR